MNSYFAESYFNALGQRIFDIQMQGTTLFGAWIFLPWLAQTTRLLSPLRFP